MKICYHGTTEKNANKILKDGFKSGTYFAMHLEDAIGFGGDYVFEVLFNSKRFNGVVDWQFHTLEKISSDNIVGLKHYNVELLGENKDLRNEIFEFNLFEHDLKEK